VSTSEAGLSASEVDERVARGQTNATRERTSRTYGEIIRANVLTRFNAILGTMLVIILVVGEIQDATFGVILVVNALIGIIQETRAKRQLDSLAVAIVPSIHVVRDGEVREVSVDDVVVDDVVELLTGDQVPVDGAVRASDGLEIDESLLTGESEPVVKHADDEVLSGSFVVAGSGRFQATHVGADAYAHRLAAEARRFTLVHSELVDGINTLLRYIQYALFPVAALLLWRQLGANDVPDALTGVVAGVVGMVPEGLVLLTSLAFGIAAVTLARRNVLVQELPAVEVLARVDVVCLDKTGTLTDGNIVFDALEPVDGEDQRVAAEALGALADHENKNATLTALAGSFASPGWSRSDDVPFSSARKWSAASFADHGSWVLGAPEIVLADTSPSRVRADELANEGRRVLVLANTDAALDGEALPKRLRAVALVLFAEKVRGDAAATLSYFADQGVSLKVISGDNPRTVSAVARRVGLPGADHAFDARELPDDESALADVMEQYSVFGRVTPQQKRSIVGALQSRGHVVAMTGDGVNDALALKDADIGIAMKSGAAATRAVAQIVLLDDRFATMPGVVAEGRRVIANIERSANLFVTKTVYALLIAVAIALTAWRYPFLPRHLTIVSTFTIGVPGFFLALAPNSRRYVPGFLQRVLRFCVPAGLVAAAASLITYAIVRFDEDLVLREARSTTTAVLVAVGLWVLVILARPFSWWKGVLVGAMGGAVALIFAIRPLRHFYDLRLPETRVIGEAALIAAGAVLALEIGWRASRVVGRRRGWELDPA